jgi:hypothetical protein
MRQWCRCNCTNVLMIWQWVMCKWWNVLRMRQWCRCECDNVLMIWQWCMCKCEISWEWSSVVCVSVKCLKVPKHVTRPYARFPTRTGWRQVGKGKWLPYMGGEFAPSGTEVFLHFSSSGIFRRINLWKKCTVCVRRVGWISRPSDCQSSPKPLYHSSLVTQIQLYFTTIRGWLNLQ